MKILKKNILIIVMEKWLYFSDKKTGGLPVFLVHDSKMKCSTVYNMYNNHGNLLQCSGSFKCLSYYKVYLFPSCIKLVG